MGKRGCFGSKKEGCFGCWIKREVADLKQRKEITTMDQKNKIQLLVVPTLTDDPGDAPDCITEYGPLPVSMAIYAISSQIYKVRASP